MVFLFFSNILSLVGISSSLFLFHIPHVLLIHNNTLPRRHRLTRQCISTTAARPTMVPGRLSRRLPQPLPVIDEDDDVDPPPIPAKSARRLTVSGGDEGGGGGGLLQATFDASLYLDSEESLPDRKTGVVKETIKDRKWVARRGGWRRLLVGALLLLGLVVGVAIGLAVGLKKR